MKDSEPPPQPEGGRRSQALSQPDSGVRRLDPESLASHVQRLYRAAYGLCGSREEAEDLVQDTYERVLRRPRFLRREQDLSYLLRVLRNTWISSKRTSKPVTPIGGDEELDALQPHHDPIADQLEARAVYDALQGLSQPLREALVAVDVLGLSYKDAARALRTREGTIMSRLHRGRGQIAEQLPD
ncbi:MAG: RNA polymerase sigma factor [Solirubrobacterales bacterium]|nr:RNA polymerase sigma factor [Solirubrobacterales bacterium]